MDYTLIILLLSGWLDDVSSGVKVVCLLFDARILMSDFYQLLMGGLISEVNKSKN